MEEKLILSKDKNIHYRIAGNGKPVVLLHGFGEDGNIWDTLAENLQDNFQFIIPDLPGSGKSEMLEGENISLEDYADVIKEILDKGVTEVLSFGEDLGEVCIIGHSMGGYIALAFAEKYPDLLNGLGLFHSSAFADDNNKKETRNKSINFIRENGAYQYLKASVPNLFADKQHPAIETIIESGKSFAPEALIQYSAAMINRPDRTDLLRTFTKPVLFIIGEKDNAVPLSASLQQCHLPAISHVHILENAGHMGMLEETEGSKKILYTFLQNIYDFTPAKTDLAL
jgi:pimeloyl-ACP methyl ester carboxylesterase